MWSSSRSLLLARSIVVVAIGACLRWSAGSNGTTVGLSFMFPGAAGSFSEGAAPIPVYHPIHGNHSIDQHEIGHRDTHVAVRHYGPTTSDNHSLTVSEHGMAEMKHKHFDYGDSKQGDKITVELVRRARNKPRGMSVFLNKHAAPASPDRLVRQYIRQGVCFIFLADEHGFSAPRVWQRWFEDARIMLNATGSETLSQKARAELTEAIGSKSRYIQGFVVITKSAGEIVNKVFERKVPKWLQHNPLFVGQGELNSTKALSHLVHEGLVKALRDYNESSYYVIVPHDSIPIKPFSYIWGQLNFRQQSQFTITGFNDNVGYPTHQPWFTLTSADAGRIVNRHLAWVSHIGARGDEGIYLWPLRILAEHSVKTSRPSKETFRNLSNYIPQNVHVIPPAENSLDCGMVWEYTGAGNTLVHDDAAAHNRWIGEWHPEHHMFQHISYGFLRYLHEHKDAWFVRGVGDPTEVRGCRMSSVDYYTFWVRIGGGDGYLLGESERNRERRFDETNQRRQHLCIAFNALERLMHLQAANGNFTRWSESRGYVPMGDPGWFHGYVG